MGVIKGDTRAILKSGRNRVVLGFNLGIASALNTKNPIDPKPLAFDPMNPKPYRP